MSFIGMRNSNSVFSDGARDAISRDDKIDSSSPLLDREPSPLLRDGTRGEPLEISSDDLPKAVFLDRDGNFSILPPKTPINVTDDVDDKKNVAKAKQDIPSQDEIVSQPKRTAGRSRLRTVVLSDDDDDDDLVNPKSKAVEEEEIIKPNYHEEENDKSKITDEVVGEMEIAQDIEYAQKSMLV